MHASDGVSKLHIVEHRHGSMQFAGFKTDEDAAAYLIYRNWLQVTDFAAYIDNWKKRLDEMLAQHNREEPEDPPDE